MYIETIEELVKDFRRTQKRVEAHCKLYPKNEKVFKKMSFEQLNKELKKYNLKCLIDEVDCCSSTHDHLICEINFIPPYAISFDDPRLSDLD